MPAFEDHFSRAAPEYARFRPTYPPELFGFLASLNARHELAWDCGTGSGQAALQLADHFRRVTATDASAAQLALAPPHPRVEYRCEPAENVALPDGSVDLVSVAAALHWFDLDGFYAEVSRVLRPGGVFAAWAYHLPTVSPEVDAVVADYSARILSADWPSGSRHVLARYTTIPFPFEEIDAPRLVITRRWSFQELAGFIGSWSAAIAYRARVGADPVARIIDRLEHAFGPGRRTVSCPLFLRVGRNEGISPRRREGREQT